MDLFPETFPFPDLEEKTKSSFPKIAPPKNGFPQHKNVTDANKMSFQHISPPSPFSSSLSSLLDQNEEEYIFGLERHLSKLQTRHAIVKKTKRDKEFFENKTNDPLLDNVHEVNDCSVHDFGGDFDEQVVESNDEEHWTEEEEEKEEGVCCC